MIKKKIKSSFPIGSVATAISGLAASLIASGSAGFFAYPLRSLLMWIFLILGIFFAWPYLKSRFINIYFLKIPLVFVSIFGIFILFIVFGFSLGLFSVPVILLSLSLELEGREKIPVLCAGVATAIFALYRTAILSIPFFWKIMDSFAGIMGNVGRFFSGKSLWTGTTFAGMDFFILMVIWYVLWLHFIPIKKKKHAIYGGLSILAGHIIYLILITLAPDLQRLVSPLFSSKNFIWYIPLLGCLIHLPIAGFMFRWINVKGKQVQKNGPIKSYIQKYKKITITGATLIIVFFVLITALYTGNNQLSGKKIVIYEKGFLNWLKPEHGDYGRLSVGMYGMLPEYIKSLGASCIISSNLEEKDLKDAHALILLYPDQPWEEVQLNRIWDFSRNGGTLLVMGEHTVLESDGSSRINEVLEPVGIKVRFDSATYAVGGWLQSYNKLAHPITLGIKDDQNQFGVVIGASLEIGLAARPILIGRWGWTDYGDPGRDSMMGNNRYDPGEKLGDIVLAAEEPLGKGRVIVFGDTSSLTNGIVVSCHTFVSRLLGYLVNPTGCIWFWVRGIMGFLLFLLIIYILFLYKNREGIVILFIVILMLVQGITISRSYQASTVIPGGLDKAGKRLAYIDSAHINAFSDESWREDGTMGLVLTLMRNGYLTLMFKEFKDDQLKKANLYVSIAPQRKFSSTEIDILKKFIENGGIYIHMCGFEESEGSESVLSEFGFSIGIPASGKNGNVQPYIPLPMGHFKSPYFQTDVYKTYVRFHSAWPVFYENPDARIITLGKGELPVIIFRKFGKGKIAVIGDTEFAFNKNLEHEGGEPFEGLRENAHFWRWFLTVLNDEQIWIPPRPETENQETENNEGSE